MATININKTLLERISGLDIEKALEVLQKIGLEIEDKSPESIIVDVTPNRPDLLSGITIAQALKTFATGKQEVLTFHNSNYKLVVDSSVKGVRPFIACSVVKNLNLTEEILLDLIQLQEKLHATMCRNRTKAAIGIYPLKKIRFPITYKALKPSNIRFIPLDFHKELNALEILKKHPKGREFAFLLNAKQLYPIFIDSNKNILSMPPIINSETTGRITQTTRDVFIEVSGFNLEFLNKVLLILVNALSIIGGNIFKIRIEYEKPISTPFIKYKKFELNKELLLNINKLTGLKLSQRDLVVLLKKSGFILQKKLQKNFIQAQPYRFDVLHWVDLAEDALISYDYENLNPKPLLTPGNGEETQFARLKEKFIELFISMGFIGVKTFHLTNPNLLASSGIAAQPIKVKNPATKEYSVLRNSLQPLLLEILSKNKTSKYPQSIFDIGTVFLWGSQTPPKPQDTSNQKQLKVSNKKDRKEIIQPLIKEKKMLAFAITHSKANYTQSRQVVDIISKFFGLKIDFERTTSKDALQIKKSNLGVLKTGVLAQGRSSRLFLNNKPLGFIGEVHPVVLEAFNLEKPVACGELDMDVLLQSLL